MIGKLLAALALCAGLFLASLGTPAAAPFGLAAAVPSAAEGLTEEVRYRRHYRHRRHWHRHYRRHRYHHWRRHHGHRPHAMRAWRDPLVFHAGRGGQAQPSPKAAAPKPQLY